MIALFMQNISRNLANTFRGANLLWHLSFIVLTILLVFSGADWNFFEYTRNDSLRPVIMVAGIGGFFFPIVITLGLYLWGEFKNRRDVLLAGVAAGQAALIAYLISIAYKAFTGRTQPEFLTHYNVVDITRDFHFGFLKNGIFWGWPSSHAATAVAVATTIFLLTKHKALRYGCVAFAVVVVVGAGIGFHWLSDALAGLILGLLVGRIVAADFTQRL